MRDVVRYWALRMGQRAFVVCLERAGSDCSHVRVALRVTF